VTNILYLNVGAFYPLFVEKNYNDDINSTLVAIVLSSLEFAGVVFSPIHAITISKMGRKNAIIIGLLILMIATFALGLISYIDYDKWGLFYAISILARFVQGYGDSLVFTTTFSIISLVFSDDKDKYISYLEAAIGFGLMSGPPLGSIIYGYLGF
jgi:MFS family permease